MRKTIKIHALLIVVSSISACTDATKIEKSHIVEESISDTIEITSKTVASLPSRSLSEIEDLLPPLDDIHVEILPPPPPPPPIEEEVEEVEVIIDFPDIEASFPGGAEALHAYIVKNRGYDDMAREMEIYGRVKVQFNVRPNGRVNMVKIIKSVQEDFDRDAKRLVMYMPIWTPAESNGKKVDSEHTILISYGMN